MSSIKMKLLDEVYKTKQKEFFPYIKTDWKVVREYKQIQGEQSFGKMLMGKKEPFLLYLLWNKKLSYRI